MQTTSIILRTCVLAALAALTACGGAEEPDIPFQSKAITVSGTVVTSTAANSATTALNVPVLLTCRNGEGSAMSDANGNYSVTTTGLTSGPCVVTATIASGATATVLRAPATGDGSRANITPLTEMLTQYIWSRTNYVFPVGQTSFATRPATDFASLDQYKALAGNKAEFDATVARVASLVQNNQAAPVIAIPVDYLSGALVARTAANPGDAHNQVIEGLRSKNMTAPNAAATIVTAAGMPSAQILNVLIADAKARPLP